MGKHVNKPISLNLSDYQQAYPDQPTKEIPGTAGKVLVLCRRRHNRQPLFVVGDAELLPDSCVFLGFRLRNGAAVQGNRVSMAEYLDILEIEASLDPLGDWRPWWVRRRDEAQGKAAAA